MAKAGAFSVSQGLGLLVGYNLSASFLSLNSLCMQVMFSVTSNEGYLIWMKQRLGLIIPVYN